MLQRSKSVLGYVLLGVSIVCICGLSRTVLAQVIHGSIYGQVTDASGAAVPNATITVTDVSKGTSVQATTNESGEYTVQNLIPDVYNVKASATGFGTVEQPWNSGLGRHITENRSEAHCRQRQRNGNCYHPASTASNR